MGLIALHSAHFSKMMKLLLGTTMSLSWRENDSEKLWCIAPTHPIAAGVPMLVTIPHEEMYGEFFDIPKPDEVVFFGTFSDGEVFRSGCTFTRGYGKIFSFQPRHEEYPIYYMPEVRRILKNAADFCKPAVRLRAEPDCRQIVRE
ncbi:MAG: ThuA domain-containing protein [Lachnospiraceae bacterium]|nr:ThuA domain-containing protein [Lachnospiraceae bacterium]